MRKDRIEISGQRLMDHPSISLSSFIRRGARVNQHTRRHIHVGIRYSSGLPGVPPRVVDDRTYDSVDEAYEHLTKALI